MEGGLMEEEGLRQMKEAGEAQGAKVAELEAKVRQMGEATGGTVGGRVWGVGRQREQRR